MRALLPKLLFASLLFLLSCGGRDCRSSSDENSVVIIFENCPNNRSTDRLSLGGHRATLFHTLSFMDEDGVFSWYEPKDRGDTISIPTFDGYAEIMHLYQCEEHRYYLLKGGDTVLVKYDADHHPYLVSLVYQDLSYVYNLPYSVPHSIQKEGYHIETILSSFRFKRAYEYFNDKSLRERYPGLDPLCRSIYVNLDSLAVIYDSYKNILLDELDSLRKAGTIEERYYAYFYSRLFREKEYSKNEILHSDSLSRFVSHFIFADMSGSSESLVALFDETEKDTTIVRSARMGILKRVTEWMFHYPQYASVCGDYLERYEMASGDSTTFSLYKRPTLSKEIESTLALQALDGSICSLEEMLSKHKGRLVYIDFWASWCGPCMSLMPDARELHKKYKGRDIDFVFISIDKNEEDWKKAVSLYPDLHSFSYRSINSKAPFFGEMRLNTIPRYMLFDKNGTLLDANAPRPASLPKHPLLTLQ